MGEYATRLSDGSRIKIGTCEDMYYLRFEDRAKVSYLPGNVNLGLDGDATQLRFRLPFVDEDDVRPGDYKDYERGLRLYRGNEDFTDESIVSDPGIIQLHHECGVLINVPCYHGHKLPNAGDCKVFWNGKSWSLELVRLRPMVENDSLRVYPIVHCRHCKHLWRYQWSDVWEFIHPPMRGRLEAYAKQFAQVA